jgi:hypothetical protein
MHEQTESIKQKFKTLLDLLKQVVFGWPKVLVGGSFGVVQSPTSLRPLFDPLIPVVLMYLAASLVTWGLAFYLFGWQELTGPIIMIVLPMPEVFLFSLPAALLSLTLFSASDWVVWLSIYTLTLLTWTTLDSRFVKKWGARQGRMRLVALAVVTRVIAWHIFLPILVSSFDLKVGR